MSSTTCASPSSNMTSSLLFPYSVRSSWKIHIVLRVNIHGALEIADSAMRQWVRRREYIAFLQNYWCDSGLDHHWGSYLNVAEQVFIRTGYATQARRDLALFGMWRPRTGMFISPCTWIHFHNSLHDRMSIFLSLIAGKASGIIRDLLRPDPRETRYTR